MSLKRKDIGKPELETSAGSLSGNVCEGHFLVEMGLSTAIVMISVLFQPGPSARQSGLMRINPPQGLKEEIRGSVWHDSEEDWRNYIQRKSSEEQIPKYFLSLKCVHSEKILMTPLIFESLF